MSSATTPGLPDYNRMAADFDRFLPQIHPVTLALLEKLPALTAGASVLDVACGTGEPGLTLARRALEVQILGVDAAEGMIGAARSKAANAGLTNIRFEVMPFETLALPDASVDVVLSRFGFLMFGDVPRAAHELTRVLRPGGHFSVAVWDDMAKNTLVHGLFTRLRAHLPAQQLQMFDRLSEWAAEGRRERLLREAGATVAGSEMFAWDYVFASPDEAWTLLRLMFGRQIDELAPDMQAEVEREMNALLASHRQDSGEYRIPHACRLLWGQR